jgi:hypothetical protein
VAARGASGDLRIFAAVSKGALIEVRRVLKPNGRLVIFDGGFATISRAAPTLRPDELGRFEGCWAPGGDYVTKLEQGGVNPVGKIGTRIGTQLSGIAGYKRGANSR